MSKRKSYQVDPKSGKYTEREACDTNCPKGFLKSIKSLQHETFCHLESHVGVKVTQNCPYCYNTPEELFKVCGEDEITYESPCYAECNHTLVRCLGIHFEETLYGGIGSSSIIYETQLKFRKLSLQGRKLFI